MQQLCTAKCGIINAERLFFCVKHIVGCIFCQFELVGTLFCHHYTLFWQTNLTFPWTNHLVAFKSESCTLIFFSSSYCAFFDLLLDPSRLHQPYMFAELARRSTNKYCCAKALLVFSMCCRIILTIYAVLIVAVVAPWVRARGFKIKSSFPLYHLRSNASQISPQVLRLN